MYNPKRSHNKSTTLSLSLLISKLKSYENRKHYNHILSVIYKKYCNNQMDKRIVCNILKAVFGNYHILKAIRSINPDIDKKYLEHVIFSPVFYQQNPSLERLATICTLALIGPP